MLELISVTKKYGKTVAVDRLGLSCAEGELLVIFGPAGAGKTTTLRLIAGIIPPTSGEVRFRGQSLTGVPPEQRNMSMVFENYALYSHITVFENLAFPLRARKLPDAEIRRQVQRMAEIIHIEDLLDRRPGFLSGGQRQRVALGRGLIRDADVYLLDEPIAHLDARLRHQMRGELKAVCADKKATVVHVTHDHREAMALSDRMVVLNKGKLEQIGPPGEVYHRPASEFVAGFVGDPPVSFIDAEWTQDGGTAGFRVEGQDAPLPANEEIREIIRARTSVGQLRLGFRASEVEMRTTKDERHTVRGEIYVVEVQGHRNLVTVKIGKNMVQVSSPPGQQGKVKDMVWMNLDPGNLHIFADGIGIYHPPASMATARAQ